MFKQFRLLKKNLGLLTKLMSYQEDQKILLAKLLVEKNKEKKEISDVREVEFKVFSQWGEDGIIQWLINNINIPHKTFIEFGVEDYRESNTRFLMMNNNWSGYVMDSSEINISKIQNSEYYWRYDLEAKHAFIDCDNINDLILSSKFDKEIGLLSIDIDGNDYWVWKQINVIMPVIVVIEYNGIFGIKEALTVPYDKYFDRTTKHYSNLYFGASLKALYNLAEEKGYAFIGCNSAGNNAFFVRKDKLNNVVRKIPIEKGYVLSKFKESRNPKGNLTYKSGEERIEIIRGMPVYNVSTGKTEKL